MHHDYRKDARLPEQLQRAMAAEAEASREARAKVIAADGEKRASNALREASRTIDESPSALQLRYLQVRPMLYTLHTYYLWGQPIKLIQVVSTSEFHEY
jgi:hypothetical protein